MLSHKKVFLKKLSANPFDPRLTDTLEENRLEQPLATLCLATRRLQACFAHVKVSFDNLQVDDYIGYENTINATLKTIATAIRQLSSGDKTYCQQVLAEYLAYLLENLEDFGWHMFDKQEKLSSNARYFQHLRQHHDAVDWILTDEVRSPEKTIAIFKNLFANKHSSRHTPFVYDIETTLENFIKFCDSIQVSSAGKLTAETVEVLLLAIKRNDEELMRTVVSKDYSLLTRTYPNNGTMSECGFTPLMYAAKYCSADIIRKHLFVMFSGKKEIGLYIGNKIKDDNSEFKDYNALMIAARWGKVDTFAYFLEFSTKRVLDLTIANLLDAISKPFMKNAEARATLLKIAAILKSEPGPHDNFDTLIEDFIFSDNITLVSKIRILYTKLDMAQRPHVASPSPVTELIEPALNSTPAIAPAPVLLPRSNFLRMLMFSLQTNGDYPPMVPEDSAPKRQCL